MELLVAVAISSVVLLGIWSFYLWMAHGSTISEAQIGMQRRASLIQEEFSRVIQGSDGILAGTCGPSSTAGQSVQVHVPVGMLRETTIPAKIGKYFCFYFSGNPGDFVRCEFTSPSSTTCSAGAISLLAGEPARRTIQVIPTTCAVAPALTAAGFGVINNSQIRACFQLQAVSDGIVMAGPFDYEIKATIRN